MSSIDISFLPRGLFQEEDAFTTTTSELDTNSHSYNAKLVPAPLFANSSRAHLTRAKSAPPMRESQDLPPVLERSYTVNAATTQANNITVNMNRHSRNLIDDFLKELVNGPETPRNLIDNFLNELAQGSPPKRWTPRKCPVPKLATNSQTSVEIHSGADASTGFPSIQGLTSSIFTDFPEPLESALDSMPIEATILAMIEELSSTIDRCKSPSTEARIPNNIPRRRPASNDLRVEYERSSLEAVPDKALFAGKPMQTCARPVLSINTNVASLGTKSLPKLTQVNQPSLPWAERPCLSINTNVSACHSNPSLERKAGEQARAFYIALINGEIDASAYMATDIASPSDGVADSTELKMTMSAVSKTSLELEYEKHEESFYMGLINGDSDSDTSSKCSPSTRFAGAFLDSLISPLSATGHFVRSGAPSPSSSLSESTILAIEIHTPLNAFSASDEKGVCSASQTPPDGEEQDKEQGEPLPESPRASESGAGNASEPHVQGYSNGTEAARPCWNLQRAESRRTRRTASRQPSIQLSPFFHTSR